MKRILFGFAVLLVGCNVFGSVDSDSNNDIADQGSDAQIAADMGSNLDATPDVVQPDVGDTPDLEMRDTGMDSGPVVWVPPGPTYFVATDGDDTGDGSIENPWQTFAFATAQLQPNDTLFIRGGTYTESLIPTTNGTEEQPIYIRAYESELPILTADIAMEVIDRSYLNLWGLTVRNPAIQFGLVIDSQFVSIDNFTFQHAAPDSSIFDHEAFLIEGGSNVSLTNSRFGDLGLISSHQVTTIGASFPFIAYNTFATSGSSTLEIIRGNQALVYRNLVENTLGGCILLLETLNAKVVENLVLGCGADRSGSPGIESYESAGSLIRHNEVHGAYNGIELTTSQAIPIQDARVTHNTVVMNVGHGVIVDDEMQVGVDIVNVLIKNNIIYRNGNGLAGEYVQAYVNDFESLDFGDVVFESNVISNDASGACATAIGNGLFDSESCPIWVEGVASADLAWFVSNEPSEFVGNSEADPRLRSIRPYPQESDFALEMDSPSVDAAAPLATATTTGNSRRIPVSDAYQFVAAIEGKYEGDRIVIGSTEATVVFVDSVFGEIEVDQDVSFTAGDEIYLSFNGLAPDIGANDSH